MGLREISRCQRERQERQRAENERDPEPNSLPKIGHLEYLTVKKGVEHERHYQDQISRPKSPSAVCLSVPAHHNDSDQDSRDLDAVSHRACFSTRKESKDRIKQYRRAKEQSASWRQQQKIKV